LVVPKISFFLPEQEIEWSLTYNPFKSTIEFSLEGAIYKVVINLWQTSIYKNESIVLRLINSQKRFFCYGSMELEVYQLDNLAFSMAILVGFCPDFSMNDD
jgi:hypothetical protein